MLSLHRERSVTTKFIRTVALVRQIHRGHIRTTKVDSFKNLKFFERFGQSLTYISANENQTMVPEVDEFIPTRQSLLSRLRDWDDRESWNDFFETYWKLIYS